MIDQREIGFRLKTLRENAKMSREEVAVYCGTSASAIAMYENGLRKPKDQTKYLISQLFGKSVEEIFFQKDGHET